MVPVVYQCNHHWPQMKTLRIAFVFPLSAALIASSAGAQVRLDHRELALDQQIIHALNRLTFGARPGDAQKVRAVGLDKWIDLQLHPDRIDDRDLQKFLDRYSIINQDQNDLLREYTIAQRDRRQARREASDTSSRPDAGDV